MQAAAFCGINFSESSQPSACERRGRSLLARFAQFGKAIRNSPLPWAKHFILGVARQLLLREDQAAKKPTTVCTKQLSTAEQSGVETPVGQWHTYFSPTLPAPDCNRSQRKDLGRGQYNSLIQQRSGDNYRLSADLVNPFTWGLNDSLKQVLIIYFSRQYFKASC